MNQPGEKTTRTSSITVEALQTELIRAKRRVLEAKSKSPQEKFAAIFRQGVIEGMIKEYSILNGEIKV